MKDMIQVLESRQLLSASLAAGVLTVTGTARNDEIIVSINSTGDTYTVSERSGSRFRRGTTTKTTFAAADVTSLVVNAGAGNDTVALRGTRSTPFTLAGTINGQDGNDRLYGGAGNDTINGGAGDDDLYGGDGDDSLSGEAGDDLIVGGDGADKLLGGDGDDLLKALDDDTTDTIDGGADSAAAGEDDADIAIADEGETVTNATTDDAPFFGHDHGGFGGGFGGGFHFGGFGFGFGGFGHHH